MIAKTNDYIESICNNPELEEKEEIHKELEEISEEIYEIKKSERQAIEEFIYGQPYQFFYEEDNDEIPIIDLEDLDKDDQLRVKINALKSLMRKIIERDYFDIGLARHILRRAKEMRVRAILPDVLDNLICLFEYLEMCFFT
jgi:hypothetical protein